MWRGVRQKLVLLSLAILVAVSFGFTLLHLRISRVWIEENLRERAIAFAGEVAATIGDRKEFESGELLERQIRQIMAVRRNVLQLDILRFDGPRTTIVATSHPRDRMAFTRRDMEPVRGGEILSRLVTGSAGRHWEVIAPIPLEGTVAGGVAAKFSLDRADALAARTRRWALTLTTVSVVVMGGLMALAVHLVVNRPVGRFLATIRRVAEGDAGATVDVATGDELGVLATHFNAMLARLRGFSEELQVRVADATRELHERYREVERLHELLFTMQRDLRHAERLALSGRIMAEVAHELGTPLHSVAGHLELLRQDLPATLTPEPVRRRLVIIEGQVARMTEIITQLLDLTQRARGEPGPVDLNRIVRDTVDLVRPGVAAAGLELHVRAAPDLPPVRGHARQLQQVVLNLVTNALDATPPGGRITVTTGAPAGEGRVELEVADTGCGIPAEDQKRIFEPFFSTKEPGNGTGLGLFISRQIVGEHKGEIDLSSDEGRGSTFRVRLPLDPWAP